MAYLAIVGSHSVNGVAALHTRLLREKELRDFDEMYPGRFNNKTNGITPRRWLLKANPGLAELITRHIGDDWIKDLSELQRLEPLAEDDMPPGVARDQTSQQGATGRWHLRTDRRRSIRILSSTSRSSASTNTSASSSTSSTSFISGYGSRKIRTSTCIRAPSSSAARPPRPTSGQADHPADLPRRRDDQQRSRHQR